MKSPSPVVPHITHTYLFTAVWLVNAADFSPDSGSVIMDYELYFDQKQWLEVNNILMMDLCLLQMLTDGLVCCGLL